MALRKQPRSIARELALLSISQVKTKKEDLTESDLDTLILAAVRTLTIEVQDNLEAASAELKRGEDRLLDSETRASDLDAAKTMMQEALEVSQQAVNRLGMAVEFPEFLQLTSRDQVKEYAIELITVVNQYRYEIESAIENVLVAWQLSRLPRIDRDILRIAVAEIVYLEVPEKVAINESVELAKRYSDEEGFRFINGVLRRLSDRLKEGLPQTEDFNSLEDKTTTDRAAGIPTDSLAKSDNLEDVEDMEDFAVVKEAEKTEVQVAAATSPESIEVINSEAVDLEVVNTETVVTESANKLASNSGDDTEDLAIENLVKIEAEEITPEEITPEETTLEEKTNSDDPKVQPVKKKIMPIINQQIFKQQR